MELLDSISQRIELVLAVVNETLNHIVSNQRKRIRKWRNYVKVLGKPKIFCIGMNKTGTTSIAKTFKNLGFVVGNQRQAELLLDTYTARDFKPIIGYCRTAQVFQDFPFSYPETYKHLEKAFPRSKLILTVRNDAEQWYESITRFHAKLFGCGRIPTAEQLKNATYVRRGWMWQCAQELCKTPEDDPYNKEMLIRRYNSYNQEVIEYFSGRPEDLVVINLAERGAYKRLMDFLDIQSPFDDFPWRNKTNPRE